MDIRTAILGLRLNADWVVLSACNKASGHDAGAEAISGLGRAFFYAGTRALLVTSWPVETTSARLLTTELLRRQEATPGLARAHALKQAMLTLMDGPGSSIHAGALFSVTRIRSAGRRSPWSEMADSVQSAGGETRVDRASTADGYFLRCR
jgi:CHAT domain-containing protein